MNRYTVAVLLKASLPSIEAVRDVIEHEDWYFRDDGSMRGKIVPLFPYLAKLRVLYHTYVGSIVMELPDRNGRAVFYTQVLLDVEGYTENSVIEAILGRSWINPAYDIQVESMPLVCGKDKSLQDVLNELNQGTGDYQS